MRLTKPQWPLAITLLLLCACTADQSTPTGNLARFQPQDYRGQWVVINYWAQWCKPCIKEIPELNELASHTPGVAVLGVNFDGARGEELQAQVDALGIAFPLILEDPSGVLGIERPRALPTTVVINPQGEITATLMGPQTLESLRGATGAGTE
ncbi:TlpA family protein disulfide reductase [Haliea sp. E17]|uniref:TlpA family protein disulfide reductase n=1 Tax=Haliea sp. E17 TaxID=3401576 RepID=UPI003AAEA93F